MAVRKLNLNEPDELDLIENDNFEPIFNHRPKSKKKANDKPSSIIDAMEKILSFVHKSKLTDATLAKCETAFNYLKERLNTTPMQSLFLSLLADCGHQIDYRQMAGYIDCHRLKLVCYDNELQELVKLGYINRIPCEHGEDDYVLRADALVCLQLDKPYEKPDNTDLSLEDFIYRLRTIFVKRDNGHCTYPILCEEINDLVNSNPKLNLVKHLLAKNYDDINTLFVLMCIYALTEHNDSVNERNITNIMDGQDRQTRSFVSALKRGTATVIRDKMVQQSCEEGFMSGKCFELTDAAKEELLDGYDYEPDEQVDPRRGLIIHEDVKEKALFYNNKERTSIEQLTKLLMPENFKGIQERLEQNGMRKGFACIFYGAPGTGKTESVLQISKKTGRDIFQVDLASLRDKFVGESEKQIKGVFDRYRRYCRSNEVAPILLFNEADAIISKRSNSVDHAVDKMENAIQNIILQEMENLEGILIATTNLTCNMDSAFERRFIYKVEFKKPEFEAKAAIWKSMLKDISEEDAMELAKLYDFSGGQIENIARKQTVNCILYGKNTTLEDIKNFCNSELLSKETKERRHINGFGVTK